MATDLFPTFWEIPKMLGGIFGKIGNKVSLFLKVKIQLETTKNAIWKSW